GSFGVQTFGVSGFAAPAGVTTFGFTPTAFNTFGVTPTTFNTFGASPFAFNTFGAPSLGAVQTFGVPPFGVAPLGTATYAVTPTTTSYYRASTQFFTPGMFLTPGSGGGGGGGGGDVANEIKQIKERLKSIEDDVAGLRKRLDGIAPPKA